MGKGKELGAKADEAFGWASNVKRAWMFVLGALVIGIAIGLYL